MMKTHQSAGEVEVVLKQALAKVKVAAEKGMLHVVDVEQAVMKEDYLQQVSKGVGVLINRML